MNRLTIIFGFIVYFVPLSAQTTVTFGNISQSDLEMTEYSREKEAAAVYLLDWCEAKIDIFQDKPLTVTHHYRIKILKPEGLDYATKKFISPSRRLHDFKASTFNLESGKIVETQLNKKEIFYQRRSPVTYSVSFAFTNVKVGSIIECSYSVSYESMFDLYPWAFQHSIPVVYSEYNVITPGLLQFKYEMHANNLNVDQKRTENDMTLGNIRTTEVVTKFSCINVPAFKAEPYTCSESDQVARIEFEVGRISMPNYNKNLTPTYAELSKDLLKRENFGGILEHSHNLEAIVKKLTRGMSDIAKIKAIHQYITANVKWNEEEGIFASYPRFRKILKLQNGSVADINLLFVAMLQKAGFAAHPVVLSTRENGKLVPYYSIVSKFNYVVAHVSLNDKDYLMDATNANRPFNELPFECLNGQGRIIDEHSDGWITLKNKEQQYDQVFLTATLGHDESLLCNVQRMYGSYSAFSLRKIIRVIGQDGYLEMLKQKHGNWEFSDLKIENLDSIDNVLNIKYTVKANDIVQRNNDLCVINPVLFFAHNQNPFQGTERKFPIEFGCAEDEVYSIMFKIPEEYKVDEYPGKLDIKLADNAAVFNYQADNSDKMISISYRYKRKQDYFGPEEYPNLREFFNQMIKKQSELIILKKSDGQNNKKESSLSSN